MAKKTEAKKGESWRKGYQQGSDETAKAYGGCSKCYGKGYSTQGHGGAVQINMCTCDRGKQIDRLLKDVHKSCAAGVLADAQHLLPEFIEEHYPKGKTKDRGLATVACAQLLLWLGRQKHLKL